MTEPTNPDLILDEEESRRCIEAGDVCDLSAEQFDDLQELVAADYFTNDLI